jgi:hypothetical protein
MEAGQLTKILVDSLKALASRVKRDDFLPEVRRVAEPHSYWDADKKHSSVNIDVLCIVFRELRQNYAECVPDDAAFFQTLLPWLQQYAAQQAVPFYFQLTSNELNDLAAFANWMAFVLFFIPAKKNKTLLMALVAALSNIMPYIAGGACTVYSRRMEAVFHFLSETSKPSRVRKRKTSEEAGQRKRMRVGGAQQQIASHSFIVHNLVPSLSDRPRCPAPVVSNSVPPHGGGLQVEDSLATARNIGIFAKEFAVQHSAQASTQTTGTAAVDDTATTQLIPCDDPWFDQFADDVYAYDAMHENPYTYLQDLLLWTLTGIV